MTTSATPAFKRMRLRFAGTCRGCGGALAAGQPAVYHRTDKQVECITCFDEQLSAAQPVAAPADAAAPAALADQTGCSNIAHKVTPEVVSSDVDAGTAGASARSEYERRVAKREQHIRSAHPKLGGLILALSDEPQSTQAWRRGAVGEEKLGRTLDAIANSRGALVLHDRRIPRSRANIDHIMVGPAGVFVIDAKRYKGRPHLRVEGGIMRPRVETLMVGRRDCSKLVAGICKQVNLVTDALRRAELETIPVRGMLCFIDAEWPLFGGAFVVEGIDVLWPKKISERFQAPQVLKHEDIPIVHEALARHFPRAEQPQPN